MSICSKAMVLSAMEASGLVPVFYHDDAAVAKKVLKGCYDGGIRLFEFTNRGDFAHETFRELSRLAQAQLPGMLLGAGSVSDPGTAALYIQLGARFIVGPLFHPAVAALCHRRGIPYIPGCATPTEIGNAQEAGCDICKVFPGETLGPGFIKAVLAPMPWSRLMVSGGVQPTRESLGAWFRAGACCVSIGSGLFPPALVAESDGEKMAEHSRRIVALVQEVRSDIQGL